MNTMKAVVCRAYGRPEIVEVPRPALTDDGVLVRVRAGSLNALDWYFMAGKPYFMRLMAGLSRPKPHPQGADFAGTVEAVGANVRQSRPGDDVFGALHGAFAEYVNVPETRIAPRPANATFEEAAALPIAGITALQGLRDHGRVRPGHKVLVHGASGGVGTFAVQVARILGAEVTAVCGTRAIDVVRRLGADHVVDYTREDFARMGRRFDLVFDVGGGRAWAAYRRVLTPAGRLVLAGGSRDEPWLGPVGHFGRLRIATLFQPRRVVTFVARVRNADLVALKDLVEAGRLAPAIDGRYPWDRIGEALAYLGEGHPRGKIVLTVPGR
jgi:NADPH:quinone reductase-like Zn-dependent oxidoreductase